MEQSIISWLLFLCHVLISLTRTPCLCNQLQPWRHTHTSHLIQSIFSFITALRWWVAYSPNCVPLEISIALDWIGLDWIGFLPWWRLSFPIDNKSLLVLNENASVVYRIRWGSIWVLLILDVKEHGEELLSFVKWSRDDVTNSTKNAIFF